jgi:hypothetical protein
LEVERSEVGDRVAVEAFVQNQLDPFRAIVLTAKLAGVLPGAASLVRLSDPPSNFFSEDR